MTRSPAYPRDTAVPLSFVLIAATLVLATGLLVRFAFAQRADLGPEDLARFEDTFEVDLPDWYGRHPFFLDWTRGDGQAFVALAVDLDLNDSALRLTSPSYRYIRVGYAWLGRAIVGGNPDLVPVGLFAVNALAIFGIGAVAARLTGRLGPQALLLLVNPAIYIGIKSDTPETLAVLLLMLALSHRSNIVAAISAAALGTVRPTYMTALFVRSSRGVLTVVCGVAAALMVQVVARISLPASDSLTGGNVTWPIVGYVEALPRMRILDTLVAAAVVAAAAAAVFTGISKVRGTPRVGWITTGGLALSLGAKVVERSVNTLRAVGALPVVWILGSRGDGPPPALARGDRAALPLYP